MDRIAFAPLPRPDCRLADQQMRRVGKIACVTSSRIARARFCPRADAHPTRGQRRAGLRAPDERVFAPCAHPTAAEPQAPPTRERGFFSPQHGPQLETAGAVFSESQIDDFVMAITSAEAVVWHFPLHRS